MMKPRMIGVTKMSGKKTSEVPESDRWLIDGDCSKCRRKNYCKKSCTKNKRRIQRNMQMIVYNSLGLTSLTKFLNNV